MRDKSFYKEKAEAIKNDVLEIQKKGAILDLNPLPLEGALILCKKISIK